MATSYTEYPLISERRAFSWSGIFAGALLFLAIEATFGILGVAVFASAVNPTSINPVGTGIGVGAGIWMVILSIISLYFAGRLASQISGALTRNMGIHTGIVTFGMCILACVLIAGVMGRAVGGVTTAGTSVVRMVDVMMTGGYWMFLSMILGMIAAAWGGIHGAQSIEKRAASTVLPTSRSRTVPEEKRAA